MKAIYPTRKNKVLFLFGYNVFMLLVFLVAHIELTARLVLAANFGAILIVLNWLPKTPEEMDEREIVLYLKGQQRMLTGFSVLVTLVFAAHLVFYQQMSVIHFMLWVGIPFCALTSWESFRLQREMLT